MTASRIFEGQQRGVDGESNVRAFEAFPYLAASKTYSADAQVSDSAPTATAMVTGVETKNDLIGVDQTASLDNCEDRASKKVTSIFEMAEPLGMATGVVSTARITHATPAATYAHTANRDWETDKDMADAKNIEARVDIARQLVEWMPDSDGFKGALGGGRRNFIDQS